MRCTPLDAPFGAQLHLEAGLPLSPLSTEERATLARAFAQYGLLVVREGPISDAEQIELLAALGRIEPNRDGTPLRMEVTNQHDQTTAPDGELVFHSDYAYDPNPIPGISMYGALVEGEVTPTCFASGTAVLDRLPKRLVSELRTLRAAHACFLEPLGRPGERAEEPDPLIPRGAPGWGPAHYWTHHPAIFEARPGVETLFLCLQHTDRLIGLPRNVSDGLLEEVYGELYAPAQVYEHAWQPHDLVIWDNLAIQHARPEPRPNPRTLRRYHLADVDLTEDYLRVAREQGLV